MQRLSTVIPVLCNKSNIKLKILTFRNFCSEVSDDNKAIKNNDEITSENLTQNETKLSGFAKAFEKFETPEQAPKPNEPRTFANLLRHSKFIDLGDPSGKIVAGQIFHVVENDLYIDFGWKFHCVCTKPIKNSDAYIRGAMVKLLIKDLELSSMFLGASRDLTILEADCILLGLIKSPIKSKKSSTLQSKINERKSQ